MNTEQFTIISSKIDSPFEGVAKTTEPDIEEMMPSCCPLMILDYIYLQCSNNK